MDSCGNLNVNDKGNYGFVLQSLRYALGHGKLLRDKEKRTCHGLYESTRQLDKHVVKTKTSGGIG